MYEAGALVRGQGQDVGMRLESFEINITEFDEKTHE